mgnify:CR=1 FL=1
MTEAAKPLRVKDYQKNSGAVPAVQRDKMPKLFLKAGVTARDNFQTMCQKLTGNGRDLLDFAYGVLMATEKKTMPTSYGKERETLMYSGMEVTMNDKKWAAEFLANRGFGRAEQHINVETSITNKSTDELKSEAIKLLRKIAKVQEVIIEANPPQAIDISEEAGTRNTVSLQDTQDERAADVR